MGHTQYHESVNGQDQWEDKDFRIGRTSWFRMLTYNVNTVNTLFSN